MKLTCTFLLACLFALTASAQSPQFTSIALVNPTLYANPSGALKPGAVYKYANAGGSGSNKIDAYIEFVKVSNKHNSVSTQDDNIGLFAFDNPASVNNPGGYDSSFQPVVSSSHTNASGLWTLGNCGSGSVQISHSADQNYLLHFHMYFKKAGTQIDTALNVRAAFIDIDGFGGGTEAEQDAFMPGTSYNLDPNTTLTLTKRSDGLMNAEGRAGNVAGLQITNTTSITQVTYLYRTYVDFAFGMNTHNADNAGACYSSISGGRLKSVSFASQPTGCTQSVATSLSISGTVWDDSDNSANNTFNNIKTNTEVGTNGGGMYVYAIDVATNAVIGRATVAANGTWSMTDVPRDFSVKLTLSKTLVELGVVNPVLSATLNTGWTATSPLNRPTFVPGTVAGTNTTITGLDFGIERTPSSIPYTGTVATPALNAIKVLNSPSTGFPSLSGTDPEDGSLGTDYTLVLKTLSLNGNQLYYGNGTGVLKNAGDTIYNYNPAYLKMKFSGSHSQSASFTFQFIDKAKMGGTIATYTINWGTSLPIKLTSFDVQKAGNTALLTWSVENEHSNEATTYAERSINGKDWIRIGEVATSSNTPQATYHFTDNHTVAGVNYYRLAMVDMGDLSQQYSAVAKLTFGTQSTLNIYPNPATDVLNIGNPDQTVITGVRMMNQVGSVVYNSVGSKSQIDVSTLPPGNYIVQVMSGENVETFKVSKH